MNRIIKLVQTKKKDHERQCFMTRCYVALLIMRITSQKKVLEYLNKGFKIETYTPAYFGARTLYYLTNYKDIEVTVPGKTISKMMENKVVDENLCYRPNAT